MAAASASTSAGENNETGPPEDAREFDGDAIKEILREQYVNLIEMDKLAREKLFILQVQVL